MGLKKKKKDIIGKSEWDAGGEDVMQMTLWE